MIIASLNDDFKSNDVVGAHLLYYRDFSTHHLINAEVVFRTKKKKRYIKKERVLGLITENLNRLFFENNIETSRRFTCTAIDTNEKLDDYGRNEEGDRIFWTKPGSPGDFFDNEVTLSVMDAGLTSIL